MRLVQELAVEQDGLVTTTQCHELGIARASIDHLLRTRRWRSLGRGVYLVDSDLHGSDLPPRTLIRAGVLSGGPNAAAVIHSAAAVHEIQGAYSTERGVHINLPGKLALPRRVGHRWLVPHQLAVDEVDLVEVAGIRTTSAVRTVADVLLRSDRLTAISMLDSALNKRLITEDDLLRLHLLMAGRRGVVTVRGWVPLADCRAESPLESRVRIRCADGGVPPDQLQAVVGRWRVDMLWEEERVVAEADGEGVHSQPGAVFHDRARQNDLVNAGYTVLRFTWQDTLSPAHIPRMVRQALRQGRRIRPSAAASAMSVR